MPRSCCAATVLKSLRSLGNMCRSHFALMKQKMVCALFLAVQERRLFLGRGVLCAVAILIIKLPANE
ncbi:Hypothetical predicted protein [Cloeon dipterum]|uniref:Uncharacterized protein n=1 Tax=Cloeon dipterum TaxID=197152 RepID=A0A8S1DZX4_9INSE|nr:Hypothetical predicted protein [Cloeon dipterum]